MAAEVRRDSFKVFWDRYSDKPDTNSMMLNHSAEELESADRADILSCLPHLANKDVVDIGAGIGRFTTVLAETARWVLSTDFIESFIAKNQERNAHMGNVNYQVGDAVNLQMESKSVDLVFTNWLMMYLSDKETIEFLFNSLRWLRADGFVHLRESCSEPSTGRTKTNTMHTDDANPTHYRFSSLYIQLLRTIRYKDDEGKVWKFEVLWSCSVPTYIKRQNNWRQVHWLVKKVPAEEKEATTPEQLLKLFSQDWSDEQKKWDSDLDREKFAWTDKIFSRVLNDEIVPRNSTSFVFTPRTSSPYTHINSHLLAEKFNCNVWNVETHPYFYRTSLTKANNCKDQRVRFSWNKDLSASLDYWLQRSGSFDTFIATDFLQNTSEEERQGLMKMMRDESKIVSLESVNEQTLEEVKEKLVSMGLKKISVEDVSIDAHDAQVEYFREHNKDQSPVGSRWLLIQAQF